MTQIERYDEQGAPVYAPERGPLENLWKFMSIINPPVTSASTSAAGETFDYNEFFKQLYLSRAELDVTSSVLEILLTPPSNDTETIGLNALKFENEHVEAISSGCAANQKCKELQKLSGYLRSSAEVIKTNRVREHEALSGVILKLRESFHWPLVRLINYNQIQLSLEPTGNVPIIGIDFSPMRLFKDSSYNREQHNYLAPDQIPSEQLALITQNHLGDLQLLFQSKNIHFGKRLQISLKDENLVVQDRWVFPENLINMSDRFINNFENWNSILKYAQDFMISWNILQLLGVEAKEITQDIVQNDAASISIRLNNNKQLVLEFTDDLQSQNDDGFNSSSVLVSALFSSLMRSYLISSGQRLDWSLHRKNLLH